ncbi:hypothetical protein ABI59_22925 [Acidobacteria bacterium Mor1]|nr:hypothetical protein ABI59_22925 [Acidobacteria bacterium Mor1]
MAPAATQVTAQLLARHDRPGPRYTSYPTAPQFHTGFGPREYSEQLAGANARSDDPLALYLHVPFCRERCLYCGCHVVITRREDVVRNYLDHLVTEIDRVARALPDRRRVSQLHWGGGTPTHLSAAEMRELFAAVSSRFELDAVAEIAVEIDPRVTTAEQMHLLKELGFNRLSLGVQDFDPEVQELIGRNQSLEQTVTLLEQARALGFDQINFDLIYGLPGQSPESFRRSLDQAVALEPQRVAVYSYAHVPWIRPHQKKMDIERLPGRETKFELYAAAHEAFTGSGYVPIGMDHFALPGDELVQAQRQGRLTRNFMGYAVRAAEDLIACGISGIGDVDGAFAQNHKKLSDYYAALDAGEFPIERGYLLDRDDRIRRHVIRELMCNFTVDYADFRRRFATPFPDYFDDALERLQHEVDASFWSSDDERLAVTPAGRLFVRNISMVFDRYLSPSHDDRPLYSKTV